MVQQNTLGFVSMNSHLRWWIRICLPRALNLYSCDEQVCNDHTTVVQSWCKAASLTALQITDTGYIKQLHVTKCMNLVICAW